jgi:hypothetical protein
MELKLTYPKPLGRPDSLKHLLVTHSGRRINKVDIHVCGETKALDSSSRVEELGNEVLSGGPGKVADEESVARRADLITVGLLASGSTVLGLVLGLLGSEVKSHVTAIEERTVLLVVSLLGGVRVAEVDVSESARATRLLVGDDTSSDQVLVALEFLEEGVVIDVPCQVADEEGRTLLRVDLGLLALGILLGGLLRSLALLGRSLLGLLLGRLRLGVVGVGVGRVGAVLLIGRIAGL